jgi:uncharacterized protein (TIGR02266 family)
MTPRIDASDEGDAGAMDQDTRKDRRVKIVSLNVRYKSATVDEFIENHAHDVSRGGIYIKTASPFPPGTLLKFEIRLASDQAVIAGVGRVVWKRESAATGGEHPAGMGVKFIKIDEPSKTVIDRLVNTRPDAGQAFESEAEMPAVFNDPSSAKPEAAPPNSPRVPRKATMMGLGIPTVPPPSDDTSSAPHAAADSPAPLPGTRPESAAGMFPSTESGSERPPRQELTVMKQAAELLEEALREAGGSMEEIGTNPLFSGSSSVPGAGSPRPAAGTRSSPSAAGSDGGTAPVPEVRGASPAENKKSSTPPVEVKTPSFEPGTKAKDANDDAAKARAMVAGLAPAPRKPVSQPPRASRPSPSTKGTSTLAATALPEKARKGGGGAFIVLFVLLAAAAGALVMYRDGFFGSDAAPTPTVPEVAAPATPPATTSAAASAEPSPSEVTSGTGAGPAMSASAAPSASQAPSPGDAASPTSTARVAATPRPVAVPTPVPRWTAPPPTPAPRPTATSSAPAAPAAASASAAATAPSAATSAPTPRPRSNPADDNPY